MRNVMKTVGNAPGLLSRLPGMKQLSALRQLQGKGMEDVLGADGMGADAGMAGMDPRAMARAAGMPKGYTPPMSPAMMARARMMGLQQEPVQLESSKDREARKKKRKQERQARKKARKKK
jgi:signal recognition particle subunit SRP54